MTHHAPGPPGEPPQEPQRTRRSFEHAPAPRVASVHDEAQERARRAQAWCIVGAAVLLAGGAVAVFAIHQNERDAKRAMAAEEKPPEPAPFADLDP